MSTWFEAAPGRWQADRTAALECFDEGTIAFPRIGDDGVARIIGRLSITADDKPLLRLRLRIEYPRNFPPHGLIPNVYDHDRLFPAPDEDGHIFADNRFCLGVPGSPEYEAIVTPYSLVKLMPYLRVFLLKEFLYNEAKVRVLGAGSEVRWPGLALAHGEAGVREAGIRRNDRCHCGSGKKYKHCHMKNHEPR